MSEMTATHAEAFEYIKMPLAEREWVKAYHIPAAPAHPNSCRCGEDFPCYAIRATAEIEGLLDENVRLRTQIRSVSESVEQQLTAARASLRAVLQAATEVGR